MKTRHGKPTFKGRVQGVLNSLNGNVVLYYKDEETGETARFRIGPDRTLSEASYETLMKLFDGK